MRLIALPFRFTDRMRGRRWQIQCHEGQRGGWVADLRMDCDLRCCFFIEPGLLTAGDQPHRLRRIGKTELRGQHSRERYLFTAYGGCRAAGAGFPGWERSWG